VKRFERNSTVSRSSAETRSLAISIARRRIHKTRKRKEIETPSSRRGKYYGIKKEGAQGGRGRISRKVK